MSVKQFAGQFKLIIENLKSNGTAAIYCDNLIAYLNEVQNSPEPEPSVIELERYKADLQNWVEANKHQHEHDLEMFRSVITAGQAAIKSSFLLNGGAAIALLTFIGHLAEISPNKVASFTSGLLPFTLGVLAIVITSGLTYLSQWFYASVKLKAQKAGEILNMLSICLGLSSYALFVWGLFTVHKLFLNYV